MRKQNHAIPPVLRHNSGLNNSAIRSRKCKRPNALKHGFYSEAPLIPGEDPREFQEILAELMDEWKPSGPTLRDGVFELAELRFKTASPQTIYANEAKFNHLRPAQPCL